MFGNVCAWYGGGFILFVLWLKPKGLPWTEIPGEVLLIWAVVYAALSVPVLAIALMLGLISALSRKKK